MNRLPIEKFTVKIVNRFMAKIKPYTSNNECWIWKNGLQRPQFGINGVLYYASRVAYYIHYSKDPYPFLICHSCDNDLCVNPYHLWLGTDSDNSIDTSNKGRHPSQWHTKHVNTEELINLYNTGEYTILELATKYNIARDTIREFLRKEGYYNLRKSVKSRKTERKDKYIEQKVIELYKLNKYSMRYIGKLTGITHMTVKAILVRNKI